MNRANKFLVLGVLVAAGSSLVGEQPTETKELKERPRVFLGPYNEVAIDHYYYGYPRYAHYSPFFTPLNFYGPLIPGRSSITFSVGSDGYRGAAFATTQQLEGTNILFSLNTRLEEGDLWYLPDYSFKESVISPSFSWSNENTFVSVGFDIGERKIEPKEVTRKEQPRVQRINESPVLKSGRPIDYESEYESINVSLGHRFGNLGEIFISAHRGDDGRDYWTTGLSRKIYHNHNGRGEWFPPVR